MARTFHDATDMKMQASKVGRSLEVLDKVPSLIRTNRLKAKTDETTPIRFPNNHLVTDVDGDPSNWHPASSNAGDVLMKNDVLDYKPLVNCRSMESLVGMDNC